MKAPRPQWENVSERAKWWAVDADGVEWYYEIEPQYSRTIWIAPNISKVWVMSGRLLDIPLGIDWRTLKQQRPEPSGEGTDGR